MNKIILDKEVVNDLWSKGMTNTQISNQFGVCREVVTKFLKENNITPNKCIRKHSNETKKIISEKRKNYLKNNPDKHPWRDNKKFKSVPCEKLKEWLKSKNLNFVSEYKNHGVEGRFFSIDIALPDRMIGIEVNGNQHYNKDFTLKSYYEEREKLLESVGWKIYQIHFSFCFKLNKMEQLFIKLLDSEKKIDFDYTIPIVIKKQYFCKDCKKEINRNRVRCKECNKNIIRNVVKINKITGKREKNKKQCLVCKKEILLSSKNWCIDCAHFKARKTTRPSREKLHWLMWNYTKEEIGKMYNVSGSMIKKWCRYYKLNTPNMRGYWNKIKEGIITDYQI